MRSLYINMFILLAFLVNTFLTTPISFAQYFRFPAPGVKVGVSPEFNPPILRGMIVHPENPFFFDFILDQGDKISSNEKIKEDASRLIKYFLASLTTPEDDLWVTY